MNRISYAYDRGGILCRVTDSTGAVSEYTYNSRGQRTVVRNNIRDDVWQKTGYTYFPITNISMKETATVSGGKRSRKSQHIATITATVCKNCIGNIKTQKQLWHSHRSSAILTTGREICSARVRRSTAMHISKSSQSSSNEFDRKKCS